jgi:hypothetical protein
MKMITIKPFLAAKLVLFALAAAVSLASCDAVGVHGNGNVISESRPVSEFTSVEAHGALLVEWSSGAPSAKVTTDSNLLPYVEVTMSGSKLDLRTRESLRPTGNVRVQISSHNLASAGLSGAVRFTAQQLTGTEFNLDASGATRTELTGSATALNAVLSGASRLDAEPFQTQNVEISISGAGRAEVYATEKLSVRISGAGKVTYSGNPKSIEQKISGAGSITAKEQ